MGGTLQAIAWTLVFTLNETELQEGPEYGTDVG